MRGGWAGVATRRGGVLVVCSVGWKHHVYHRDIANAMWRRGGAGRDASPYWAAARQGRFALLSAARQGRLAPTWQRLGGSSPSGKKSGLDGVSPHLGICGSAGTPCPTWQRFGGPFGLRRKIRARRSLAPPCDLRLGGGSACGETLGAYPIRENGSGRCATGDRSAAAHQRR